MKKLLLILFLIICSFSYSQVDSLDIVEPKTNSKLIRIYNPKNLIHKLDSLNNIHKTDNFYLLKYLRNGDILKCRIRKKKVVKPIINFETI